MVSKETMDYSFEDSILVYETKIRKFRRWQWIFVRDGTLTLVYVDFEELSGCTHW